MLGRADPITLSGYRWCGMTATTRRINQNQPLRAQRASQFIVGMSAPTSGDNWGRDGVWGRAPLGVRAAPIFTPFRAPTV